MNYVVSVVRVGLVWELSPLFSRSFCRCSSMKHLGAKLIVSTVMNPLARKYERCFLKRQKKKWVPPKNVGDRLDITLGHSPPIAKSANE